jgi:hypothetical protein
VAAATLVVATTPATAAERLGSITPVVPSIFIDTRSAGGSPLVPGIERALGNRAVLLVSIIPLSNGPGIAVVHECGGAPSATVADLVFSHAAAVSNVVVPDDVVRPCITSSSAAHLIVTQVANLGSGPGFAPTAVTTLVDQQFTTTSTMTLDPGVSGTRVSPVLRVAVAGLTGAGFAQLGGCVTDGVNPAVPSGSVSVLYPAAGPLCLRVVALSPIDVSVTVLGYLDTSASTTAPNYRLPQVVFNVDAHFPAGLDAMSPDRILDTRALGVDPTALSFESDRDLSLSTRVSPDTRGVAFNLTVTGPLDDGYITAYPCGGSVPKSSSINFVKGQTAANLVSVAVSAGGHVCFHLYGRTHLIVDLAGTYEQDAGSGFVPTNPKRLVDTRQGVKVGAGTVIRVKPSAVVTPPSPDADAVALNLTVTNPSGPGYITAYPCDAPMIPDASNVNVLTNDTVPNSAVVKLSAAGEVCVFAYVTTDVIVDLAGYYDPNEIQGIEFVPPQRILDTRTTRTPVAANTSRTLRIAGSTPDVPSEGVTGALINITVTNATNDGFITAYPCDLTTRPLTSNVNYRKAQVAANSTSVLLDTSGNVCLYAYATTDIIIDVVGYVTPFARIHASPAIRA